MSKNMNLITLWTGVGRRRVKDFIFAAIACRRRWIAGKLANGDRVESKVLDGRPLCSTIEIIVELWRALHRRRSSSSMQTPFLISGTLSRPSETPASF